MSNTLEATVRHIEYRHIVCPGCGKDDGFRIDHLDDLPDGSPFGPWSCDACGASISGKTAKPGAHIELLPKERRAPALMLVEIGESNPPVFVALKTTIYKPDDPDSWGSHLTYYVDEHTCPTNLINAEAILWDGDADPHGVLTLVQVVPEPEDYDEDNYDSWAAWAMLFDKLPGQTIEGARVIRALPAA